MKHTCFDHEYLKKTQKTETKRCLESFRTSFSSINIQFQYSLYSLYIPVYFITSEYFISFNDCYFHF